MQKAIENRIESFHRDEDGLEAVQTVMIVAIASVALLTIKNQWDVIKGFFSEAVDIVIE